MTESTTSTVESGATFTDLDDTQVAVEATFIESGNQLQQVFIGLEPVLLVQPEYDADENKVTFVITAVDLDPKGLEEVLELLHHTAQEMVKQQEELEAEQN